MEGILTFSPCVNQELGKDYSIDDFCKAATETVKELAKHYQTEMRGDIVLHMDEDTPHFHFYLKNFHNDGHQLLYKFRDGNHLSINQDIMNKHFQKFDIERGIKKEETRRVYKSTRRHHEEQIAKLKKQENLMIKRLDKLDYIFEEKDMNKLKEFKNTFTKWKNENKNSFSKEEQSLNNLIVRATGRIINDKQKEESMEKLRMKMNDIKDSPAVKMIKDEIENSFFKQIYTKNDVNDIIDRTTKNIFLEELTRGEINKEKQIELNDKENELLKIEHSLNDKLNELNKIENELKTKESSIENQLKEIEQGKNELLDREEKLKEFNEQKRVLSSFLKEKGTSMTEFNLYKINLMNAKLEETKKQEEPKKSKVATEEKTEIQQIKIEEKKAKKGFKDR